MTFLVRQNPFNDLFEPFFGRFNFGDEPATAWAPPVDVAEEADKLLVRVEVPGVDEKDLKVHFEDGLLTVSGERQFEKRDDRNYHRIERSYGSFVRTFSLPRGIDANKITAAYRNGILEIEIPKLEEAKPKQIQINVNQKQIG
ncbi:MAG TPA: Hsp20/alpha crystallin family protein [Thermoanaerobaculia bacterium]|nr:Hsp20/alpha crystallin family protein [Thermoanaerobaculia bacterium]